MKQSISQALWGCLEIPLCMKVGIGRFANSIEAAKFSFLIPFLVLIPTIFIAPINPEFDEFSLPVLALKFTLHTALTMAAYYAFIYAVTKPLERREFFPQFVNACNWLNLSGFVISLPFYVLVLAGYYTFAEMKNLLLFFMMYGYLYLAFMLTHVLRTNWMLAAGLSIASMAIGEFFRFLVYDAHF